MINKQCAGCGRYFEGRFDGDYTCADCRRLGNLRVRPLSPLGVQWGGGPAAEAGSQPPHRVEPAARERTARGQAA